MRDIETRKDIELFVTKFYNKALQSEEIGYIFTEIAQIDLEKHIPIICDFWESVLLGNRHYSRNTLQAHLDLHKKTPLRQLHFNAWLALFNETLDHLFDGQIARRAKERALSIATVMQIKIESPKGTLL